MARSRRPAKKPKPGGDPRANGSAARGPAPDPEQMVRIRLYRIPLGDCFLLTFPGTSGPCHVLIDCGLVLGGPTDRMPPIVRDIAEATRVAPGRSRIDLVVVTHEHWDHLSGFTQARDVFDTIEFGALWVAWTEDPSDALARKLRAERAAKKRALEVALERLAATQGLGASPDFAMAEALRAFDGPAAAAKAGTTAEAFEYVKKRVGPEATRHCRPGELLRFPGVEGVRVLVLGPPRDEALLRRSSPRSGKNKETYLDRALDQLGPVLGLDDGGEAGSRPPVGPFDSGFGLDAGRAKADPFFRSTYFADGDSWRRVDVDWLGTIGPLALQLDNDTNNTSLALAVELGDGGPVLLFPGDAQVGNWLSWRDLDTWTEPGPGGESVRTGVDDLFARTVFYKASHHGSHNATLKALGLEKMTSPDLRSYIPVDPAFARDKKGWTMPWPDMLKRLLERTSGRVLDATSPPAEAGLDYLELAFPIPEPSGRRS